MLFISPHRHVCIMNKTNGKCSICHSDNKVTPATFIPQWTRVDFSNRDNLIPLCENCRKHYYSSFIELDKLKGLPLLHKESLMRFYMGWSKYLYKYVIMFNDVRNVGPQSTDEIIDIINEYNKFIRTNKDSLNWESL